MTAFLTPPQIAEVRAIQHHVAGWFGTTRAELLAHDRRPVAAVPRQIAMWLARAETGASYPSLGAQFERDHTTVLHGCQAVEARLQADAGFARMVADICRALRRAA